MKDKLVFILFYFKVYPLQEVMAFLFENRGLTLFSSCFFRPAPQKSQTDPDFPCWRRRLLSALPGGLYGWGIGLAQRVSVLMQAIATALGFEHPITAIIHGGGACYTFHQADGRALSIPTDEMSAETYLRLLFLLKEIILMAQAQYIVNAR